MQQKCILKSNLRGFTSHAKVLKLVFKMIVFYVKHEAENDFLSFKLYIKMWRHSWSRLGMCNYNMTPLRTSPCHRHGRCFSQVFSSFLFTRAGDAEQGSHRRRQQTRKQTPQITCRTLLSPPTSQTPPFLPKNTSTTLTFSNENNIHVSNFGVLWAHCMMIFIVF